MADIRKVARLDRASTERGARSYADDGFLVSGRRIDEAYGRDEWRGVRVFGNDAQKFVASAKATGAIGAPRPPQGDAKVWILRLLGWQGPADRRTIVKEHLKNKPAAKASIIAALQIYAANRDVAITHRIAVILQG